MQVNRELLTEEKVNFCAGEAMAHFDDHGIPLSRNDGTPTISQDLGGLSGGAFYDRTQNTLLTPANIFWARFNRIRDGGPSMYPELNCLPECCAMDKAHDTRGIISAGSLMLRWMQLQCIMKVVKCWL